MENVTDIAQKMVRDFVAHRFDEVAEVYNFPAVVFFGSNIFVLNDEQDFVSKLAAYRSVLAVKNLSHIDTVVEELTSVDNDRCEIQVRNAYFAKEDVGMTEAVIRYFCEVCADIPKIRMVEYLVTPFDLASLERDPFEMVH